MKEGETLCLEWGEEEKRGRGHRGASVGLKWEKDNGGKGGKYTEFTRKDCA